MSEAFKYLLDSDIRFVIPDSGHLRYSRVSGYLKTLCFTFDRGYIQTTALDVCLLFVEYLKQTSSKEFLPVSSVQKVRLKDGSIVYRQRIYCTNFLLLLRVFRVLGVSLHISRDYVVGLKNFIYCTSALLSMKDLSKKWDLDKWLTWASLVQLSMLCDLSGVDLEIPFEVDTYLKSGILVRAPYICSSFNNRHRLSSIFIPPSSMRIYRGVDVYQGVESVPINACKTYDKVIEVVGFTSKVGAIK